MNWNNDITSKLNIRYPVIQAPMFGVTTPEMVAAAARAGCLGSLPLADLTVENSLDVIRKTKDLSAQPFAVNVFAYDIPEITDSIKSKYDTARKHIEDLAAQHGISVSLPGIHNIILTSYREQLDVIISQKIPIVSFTFGNMDARSIERLKSAGVTLIGTCTSAAEAATLANSGIDIVCVQGWEAGGHRGSFNTQNIPAIGGFSLLTQVAQTVKVPLIYAGGICDANTLLAAKMLGAEGFQVGSLLMGSTESAFKDFEKNQLRKAKEDDITITRSFTGRYARGLRNAFIEAMEESDFILPYPYQNILTGELRRAAKAANNAGFVSIWSGQGKYNYSNQSTFDILKQLVADVEKCQ